MGNGAQAAKTKSSVAMCQQNLTVSLKSRHLLATNIYKKRLIANE